jgi:hypothetical protein
MILSVNSEHFLEQRLPVVLALLSPFGVGVWFGAFYACPSILDKQ